MHMHQTAIRRLLSSTIILLPLITVFLCESANADFSINPSITISEETYRQAQDRVEVRELDLLQVKGKETAVRIYELIGRKGALDQKKEQLRKIFVEGLILYRKQQWTEALSCFQRALELEPEDGSTKTFIRRCQYFQNNPPGPGWDGVYRLTSK